MAYHLWCARLLRAFREERNVHRSALPGDLVQLKGMPRNDSFIIQYYLYPLRAVGDYWEEGGSVTDETRPDVHWVISGGVVPRSWQTGTGLERETAPTDRDVTEDPGEFEVAPDSERDESR